MFVALTTASVVLSAFLALSSLWCRAGGLDHWHLRNPEWVPNPLSSVCYGSNQFVAVGVEGTFMTSSDGLQWSNTSYSSTDTVSTLIYAQGQYVAPGNSFVLSSTDGFNWTYHDSSNADTFVSLAYGAGMYVAVDELFGAIYSSTNGIDWVNQYELGYEMFSVAYGAGRFVGVGISGFTVTSIDGTNWDFQEVGSTDLRAVSFGNGEFVAVGDTGAVYISGDGLNWTNQPFYSFNFSALTFGNGFFVAAASYTFTDQGIFTSTDGIHWAGTASADFPDAIAAGNGLYVAVGSDSMIQQSTDHVFWNAVDTDPRARFAGIAYGNNLFVAAANGTNMVSEDGINWMTELLAYNPNGIGFGSNLFIDFGGSSGILASPDGLNWTESSSGDGGGVNGVAYGNNRFVAVGTSALTSGNGINWTNQSTPGFSAVAFGNGIFVASNGQSVRTSSDGIDWNPAVATPSSSTPPAIAFGNGTFVIVGSNGLILSSADGTNWVQRSAGTSGELSGIAFGQGTFLAVGVDGVYSSFDGIFWQQHNIGASLDPLSVAYGNNSFVLAGPNGFLMQSDPLISLGIQQQGSGVQLALSCDAGNGCRLEASTDLVSWSDVFGTNFYGSFTWLDMGVNDNSRRFYRIVSP